MAKKPKVWFVDDLQSNLDEFTEAHDQYFEVTTFLEPTEVFDRLNQERPDALLCDVFFYDTPEEAQRIEIGVSEEAAALRDTAINIGALEDRLLVGITLMEEIAVKHKNSVPFPIYAYTSKGPYLLAEGAWDRILSAGARVLLKNPVWALRRENAHSKPHRYFQELKLNPRQIDEAPIQSAHFNGYTYCRFGDLGRPIPNFII